MIICCYNSENRIVPTLAHLVKQDFSHTVNWEIILIDNNSKDNTALVAKEFMAKHASNAAFRVVSEPKPGLSNARNRGFKSAKYEFALMVDDDNSLSPNYVEGIFRTLSGDPNIGMAGGLGVAALDQPAPDWFEKFSYCFAVGNQHPDETTELEHLYGAGLGLRLSGLDKLKSAGFQSLLSDRTGSNLMSGGDTELCFGFRMAGYKLKYIPDITFQHHLPSSRINWNYLRRLFSGFGQSKAYMEVYTAAVADKPLPIEGKLPYWFDRTIYLLRSSIGDLPILIRSTFMSMEGNERLLTSLAKWGHLKRVVALKGAYFGNFKKVYDLKSTLQAGDGNE